MKKLTSFIALCLVLAFALTGCGSSASNSKNASFGDKVDYTITGIDAGAGEMGMAQDALSKYNLSKWTLQSGSDATMTAALAKAEREKKPIVVVGYSPHWMFAKYDLKYLKDPKGVFGKAEEIHTVVHKGFVKQHPNAAKLLKQFNWTPKDMGKVMLDISNGMTPEKAAAKWIKANPDIVSKWTKGAKNGNGTIRLAYVSWASSVASNNVMKQVLESKGYTVKLQQLQASGMWTAVAKGDDDAMLSAWLPTTHKAYYARNKDKVTDLAVNLRGTKLGLVVPKYVKINSIEDLKTK